MKLRKFFSVLFSIIGTSLLVLGILLSLFCLNRPPQISSVPAEAERCSEALLQALSSRDYVSAQALMYGQPELGLSGQPTDPLAEQVWVAFEDSLTFSYTGKITYTGSSFCRDMTVSYRDVSGVPANAAQIANTLLKQRLQSFEDDSDLYDESGNVRQDVLDEIFHQALTEALAQAQTVTVQATVGLISQDGRWWALPDTALLQALSSGM